MRSERGIITLRRFVFTMKKLMLSVVFLGAMSAVMFGGNNNNQNGPNNNNNNSPASGVPEIDPNSAISAVFLLSSGVLMIKGRRKQ